MNAEVFNQQHILFDETATTQEEAFRVIAEFAHEMGFVTNAQAYFEGLKEREAEATTGFKDQLAIPHSKNTAVLKPGIFLVKFAHKIPWQALDGQPVKVAFALTIPEEGATEHLKLLSLIARKLIDQTFREGILTETEPKKLATIVNQIDF
ncbi:PTS sugar transporter subunit IIA [Enterococcus faecalis]